MKIEGNTFIVTGGLGGIGGAVAKAFLARGAKIALFDVLPTEKGALLAAEYHPTDAIYINVDIASSDSTKDGVEAVVEKLGNLKGVVHCAGIAVKRPWSNDVANSISDFIKMMNVNAIGTFIVNAHVADAINKPLNHPGNPAANGSKFWTTDEERGIIVNFSSAAAHGLYARTLCYGPSKVAVAGITRSMADFLGPSGIRVNSISPSIVQSNMTAGFSGYFNDDLLAHAAFPRKPVPVEEIVRTVLYLVENGYVNGEDIRVDSAWRLVTARIPGGPDPRELAPGLE
ncbi:3-oxoacyl-reductase [Lipomyces orientalis]|uniref:3-oxoacyl-reductase n=1 Tax=Lipomyces orientalis TaxID=1233043 RepID=A0ACC3TKW8_9ASCO